MKNEILLDSFRASGEGESFLRELAKDMDEHTEIKKVDLQQSYMFYYMDTDDNGRATFAQFIPGDEYISYDSRKGLTTRIDAVDVDAYTFPAQILNEIEENPDSNGLIFVFDEDGDITKPYAVSGFIAKTLAAKIPGGYNVHSVIDAMQLATMIGEMDDGCEIYIVSRKSGNSAKMVGAFKNPCRRNLTELVEEVLSRPAHVYKVTATQKGFDFVVAYYDEASSLLDNYEQLDKEGYTPCFVVSTSDSGYRTDSVSAAWMDETGQLIIVDTMPIKGSVMDVIDALSQAHAATAQAMDAGYQVKRYFDSAEELAAYVQHQLTSDEVDLGKKTVAAMVEAAKEAYEVKRKQQRNRTVRYSHSELVSFIGRKLSEITANEPDYKKERVSTYMGNALQTSPDQVPSLTDSVLGAYGVPADMIAAGNEQQILFSSVDEFTEYLEKQISVSGTSVDEKELKAFMSEAADAYVRKRRRQRKAFVRWTLSEVTAFIGHTVTKQKPDCEQILSSMLVSTLKAKAGKASEGLEYGELKMSAPVGA